MIESHLISWHDIYNYNLGLHNLVWDCYMKCCVNITCVLRWRVTFLLLYMAYPI